MLIKNLFDEVLIEPAKLPDVSRLQIVSGYATANMAGRHIEELQQLDKKIHIELVVGMVVAQGISKDHHSNFKKLTADNTRENLQFDCHYVTSGHPVHAKSYCWLANKTPVTAFIGSANYTNTGFSKRQIEAMTESDAQQTHTFFRTIKSRAIHCLDDSAEELIVIPKIRKQEEETQEGTKDSVTLSLLDKRTDETPTASGINWGQRGTRNRDQAYINIPSKHYDFFPERPEQFMVLTDDGETSFIMVRAQDAGKGLHTTQDNSILGNYLRKRIGVPSGTFVTKQHLLDYGRTDVTFIKIDDETYQMDFRPNAGMEEEGESGQD